jgi:predicted nucleic acid-binding OB-fold protein
MCDFIETKKVICNIQKNGIIRDNNGMIIGRFNNEFSFNEIKESDYSEYMKVITTTIKEDKEYYFSWQSNIAVSIQDRLSDINNIHEISNCCAKDFLDRLTK